MLIAGMTLGRIRVTDLVTLCTFFLLFLPLSGHSTVSVYSRIAAFRRSFINLSFAATSACNKLIIFNIINKLNVTVLSVYSQTISLNNFLFFTDNRLLYIVFGCDFSIPLFYEVRLLIVICVFFLCLRAVSNWP